MGLLLPSNNISRVFPNTTTVIKFERGATIDRIKLELKGGLLQSHIGNLVLKADGHIIWFDNAAQNIMRAKYHNINVPANQIVLDFTERDSRNGASEQYVGCLPSNLIRDLSLEIEVLGTAPQNGVDIACHTIQREPTSNPFITKFTKHTFDVNAIGVKSVFIPVGTVGGIIKRMFMHEAAIGQVKSVDIVVNQRRIQVATRAQIEAEQISYNKVPQAKMFVQDFVVDGNMWGAFNTGFGKDGQPPNVELLVDCASTGVVDVYFNSVDPIHRT